ncbi:MAG: hypothetical protein HOQ11_00625 [Gemmatimonadaceae bacterium]|nr:hypothetical protein [Gemmatimonadaceae bacterium]NUQ94249.1 hypothetical protein [Gemmatimonadaceae bacterium]NUR20714.1 hypothetical protein [Gemmatimonadaceae bacterium]NUS95892.1 hypothetical protein [Gemmatimonadaceae bacterium]
MTRTFLQGGRVVALAIGAMAFVAGCGGGAQQQSAETPAPANPSGVATTTNAPWPVKTREQLDLWLHGFAMVQADTTRVPFFRRGYRDQMVVEKNRRGVTTLLDQNRAQLAARFAMNRNLVGAQFAALYFGSWDEMQRAIAIFLQAQGDPGRARDQQQQQIIAFFAQSFNTPADRDWLELFSRSLADEYTKFYHEYWIQEQRARGPVLAAVDSLWQGVYRPKFQTYLSRTQQESGDFLLSLPLDGEGRTVSAGKRENSIAVEFPESPRQAVEAVYVFAHEAVGAVANQAVIDNVTPAERREGRADRMQSAAAVRGGALLIQRVAPELLDGYSRFYLRAAGVTPSGDVAAALASTFPITDAIRDAIGRQLDTVLGGI